MWMICSLENEHVFYLATEWTGSVPAVHDQDSANTGQLHLYLMSNSPNRMSTLVLELYLLGSPERWGDPFTLSTVLPATPVSFLWLMAVLRNSHFYGKHLSLLFISILNQWAPV